LFNKTDSSPKRVQSSYPRSRMLFVILGILKTKLSLNKACLYYQAFWHPVHTIADENLTVYGFKKNSA